MKKINYTSILTAWICFVSMLAMGGNIQGQNKNKGVFEINNTRFDISNQGDSLIVSLELTIKDEAINKSTSLRVTPIIENQGNSFKLPHIRITGKSREHQNKRRFALASKKDLATYLSPSKEVSVKNNNQTTFQYSERIPYEMWMHDANFVLQEEFSDYGNNTQVHKIVINQALNYRVYQPYVPQTQVAFLTPEKEVKMRKRQGRAYLDFPVGRSILYPNFRNNVKELSKIDDALSDVVKNEDANIKNLFIEGYASPEGRHSLNERLSRNRTNALKKYIIRKYGLHESVFTLNSVAENWDGLVDMLQASEMQYKDEILKIIAETENLDKREKKIRLLAKGKPYRKMLREIFPELRRVEYQIDYQVRDYTVEKSKEILSKNPEFLSLEELYNLALSYGKDSKEYINIMTEVAPQYYSNNLTALNNAAAAMLEDGELRTAKRHLDKAMINGGKNSAEILNNLGIFNLLAGNLDKADELFDKAIAAGYSQAVHNKQEVDKKRKDNKLIESFKNR